jgi:hypothetical protein
MQKLYIVRRKVLAFFRKHLGTGSHSERMSRNRIRPLVATLPLTSAKRMRHHHHHRHVVSAAPVTENAGPRFVANALHQLVVPLEVTFAPSPRRVTATIVDIGDR